MSQPQNNSAPSQFQRAHSFDPRHLDQRPATTNSAPRRLSNHQISQLMLANIAYSIAKYYPEGLPRGHHLRVNEQVQKLMNAAKRKARRTGRELDDVLEEHQDAMEENHDEVDHRFLRDATTQGRSYGVSRGVQQAMVAQDERRENAGYGPVTGAAAHAIESARAARDTRMVPYVRPELQPPAHVSTATGLTRRPAPRHEARGSVPNTRALALQRQDQQAQLVATESAPPPIQLTINQNQLPAPAPEPVPHYLLERGAPPLSAGVPAIATVDLVSSSSSDDSDDDVPINQRLSRKAAKAKTSLPIARAQPKSKAGSSKDHAIEFD